MRKTMDQRINIERRRLLQWAGALAAGTMLPASRAEHWHAGEHRPPAAHPTRDRDGPVPVGRRT